MSNEKNLEELGKFEELTPEQIAERYPHLSKEDVSFLTQEKSFEVNSSKFGIGMRKYEYLQQKLQNARNFEFSNPTATKNPFELTELEKKQMAEFESKRPGVGVEPNEKMKEYARFIRSGETKDSFTNVGIPATKKIVYGAFKSFFELTTEKKFEENADNIANVGAVINYFLQDENFFQSPCLVENLDGKILKPSFNKGLLIIGCYGNGKTTILQVLSMVFDYFNNRSYNELWDTHKDWRKLTFKFKSCHELVTEFEGISEHDEKLAFFTKYSNSRYAFDDLTKESVASNYGKKELMREVFEKRYDKRIEVLKKDAKYKTDYACKNIKTIVTMNFPDYAPNNVESALDLLGERYGGHIYDRAKEMFNILVFKGKSMRN